MAVYYIDNVAQSALATTRGNIYRFDQNNTSNSTAPLNLSTTNDGENNGGSPYNDGVSYWLNNIEVNRTTYLSGFSGATSRFIQIDVQVSAPATLYYYAVGSPGYGAAINVTG